MLWTGRDLPLIKLGRGRAQPGENSATKSVPVVATSCNNGCLCLIQSCGDVCPFLLFHQWHFAQTFNVFIRSPASFLRNVPTFILMICCSDSSNDRGFSHFTGHWHTYVCDALIRMQRQHVGCRFGMLTWPEEKTNINIFLQTDEKFRQHIYS